MDFLLSLSCDISGSKAANDAIKGPPVQTGFILTELVKENALTSRVIGTAAPPCSPEKEPQKTATPELTNTVETKVTFNEDIQVSSGLFTIMSKYEVNNY